jgi:uncharacterized protein YggE
MDKLLQNTEKNKNILYLLGSVALGMLALGGLVFALREVRYMVMQPLNTTYIDVAGTGEIQTVPDIAEVTYTLRAESSKVTDAQAQIKTKAQGAVDVLKALQIEEKDIKTISYNSQPKYEYKQSTCTASYCPPSNPVVTGYEVTQTVQVKVRTVDQVGTVLEKLGALAINELSGPNFTVDDIEKSKSEARAKAIKDAQDKAKILTKQLGVHIIRISGYSDGSDTNGYPEPMYSAKAMSADSVGVAGDSSNGIMQGQNTITSKVTITYEVK